MGFPGGIGLSAGVPFPWDSLQLHWAKQSPPWDQVRKFKGNFLSNQVKRHKISEIFCCGSRKCQQSQSRPNPDHLIYLKYWIKNRSHPKCSNEIFPNTKFPYLCIPEEIHWWATTFVLKKAKTKNHPNIFRGEFLRLPKVCIWGSLDWK